MLFRFSIFLFLFLLLTNFELAAPVWSNGIWAKKNIYKSFNQQNMH